jgi:hypothetical protein
MKITAREAKEITDTARNINIEDIYTAIKRAATDGEEMLRFDLSNKLAKFAKEIVKKLKEDGFDTIHESGSDQRDGESWNYLVIRW